MADSNSAFGPRSSQDLLQLLREQPLAWLVSGAGADFRATLLPVLPLVAEDGRVTGLMGHFARSNPHVSLLRRDGRAAILMLGPQGYISPSWMRDRSQAPTWNYASAQCLVDVEFRDDAESLAAHLQELVAAMEAGRPQSWAIPEMGARYAQLSKRIVGFVAQLREVREKYKLGQDERDDVFADIVAALAADSRSALPDWMLRFNPGRPVSR
jgi:transcriptional regulator